MKKVILVLIGVLMINCSKEYKTQYSIDSEKVFLIITKNTTETELTKIASEFKSKKNIIIDFSNTEFSINGKVKNLNLKVDCNDGYSGVANNHGKTFTLYSGFLRDYNENAETPFMIGSMNKETTYSNVYK